MIDVHEIRYIPFETLVALIIYCFEYVFAALVGEKSLLLIRFFAITSFFQFLGAGSVRRLHQNALLEPVLLLQNSIFLKTYF